ncbi:MAG: hypothetical protein PHC61_11900 [Chitinivibrionales bacterium]|nr:hypothetical protein [Chitinivibrionales bacterium]
MTTATEIKPLPETFGKPGVVYGRVKRSASHAIYAIQYDEAGPVVGYDVVVARVEPEIAFIADGEHRERILTGKLKEYYPESESWGRRAWSYTTLDAAESKFQELKLRAPADREARHG